MTRVNLTLDDDTFRELKRYAGRTAKPVARLARELVREGIERREAAARRRRLAEDYAAGRRDAHALLEDLETAQLDLLDDDEA